MRNPDILLLDEATSSLDSESEKLVQAAFERAGKGRTMVAVAHRLATVQNADVIFVLGDGKLLEKGNHHDLLAKRGVYWQMVRRLMFFMSKTASVFIFSVLTLWVIVSKPGSRQVASSLSCASWNSMNRGTRCGWRLVQAIRT
jgi:energy-coupling factor transporter ATP-binding protein EcfA2